MRLGSLFAGIGGFDLAAHWMGWETAWFSEVDPYACRVLEKNFPGVPNLGDITRILNPPPVDLLAGGFPCQDISLAGKGAGIEGERSGLWKHYARIAGLLRPDWIVAENVAALRTRGLDVVLHDLSALGYDAEWHCIPASAVGAPHQRDRIWIVAFPEGAHPVGAVGDRICARLQGHAGHDGNPQREAAPGSTPPAGLPRGGYSSGWWDREPGVGRVVDGVPHRVDRLKALGNALVPQVAHLVFQAINDLEGVTHFH